MTTAPAQLIPAVEAARRVGVSERTFRKIRHELPGAVRVGGRTMWHWPTLARHLEAKAAPAK